jgi:hypothetical protein
MPSLRTSLLSKNSPMIDNEQNLETGRIWSFSEGTVRTKFYAGWCWIAPAAGTAIIEIWGAGGSAARMCCCGGGLPGNSGAYSKKTITVTAGSKVYGTNGFSCGNTDLCFRGCSESTGLCWCTTLCNGCMCAEGGRGGTAICSTGTSMICCFGANSFCRTVFPDNCGIVCNFGSGTAMCCAQAYGGDVNCSGRFNCTRFMGCYPNCVCQFSQTIYIPPGLISQNGSYVTFNTEADGTFEPWSGSGLGGFLTALNAITKQPTQGHPHSACWSGNRMCQCYEASGCIPFVPKGVGGPTSNPCPDVRQHGYRGGMGAARIKFIPS